MIIQAVIQVMMIIPVITRVTAVMEDVILVTMIILAIIPDKMTIQDTILVIIWATNIIQVTTTTPVTIIQVTTRATIITPNMILPTTVILAIHLPIQVKSGTIADDIQAVTPAAKGILVLSTISILSTHENPFRRNKVTTVVTIRERRKTQQKAVGKITQMKDNLITNRKRRKLTFQRETQMITLKSI